MAVHTLKSQLNDWDQQVRSKSLCFVGIAALSDDTSSSPEAYQPLSKKASDIIIPILVVVKVKGDIEAVPSRRQSCRTASG
jgi:hypothetical protein